jgi:hypothetical protein
MEEKIMYGWLAVLIPCAICVVVWWAALKSKKEEPERKMTKKELARKEREEAIFRCAFNIFLIAFLFIWTTVILIAFSSGSLYEPFLMGFLGSIMTMVLFVVGMVIFIFK